MRRDITHTGGRRAAPIPGSPNAFLALIWLGLSLFIGGTPAAAADCLPLSNGLVNWWPGDGSANDIAFTNHGALQGGATASAAGVVGPAFHFDGTNGLVRIPDSPSFRPTNLTVECLVRFASLDSAGSGGSPAGDQYIVFKQNTRSSNFEGYDLSKTRVGVGDVFRFLVASASGQAVEIHSATVISPGTWYHVAGVRGSNFLQLYVNGQLERQTNVGFAQDYGNFPLYFGSSGQAFWDHKLKGDLDEVSLNNRALAANEIAGIFSAGAAGKCKAPNITVQPLSQAVVAGTNVSFGVAATGFGALGYQWRVNGVELGGRTDPSLTLTNVQPAASGDYTVIVTNVLGSATSAVATLTVGLPPSFTTQPVSQVASLGSSATFSGSASGIPPCEYRWQKDGIDLLDGGHVSGAATTNLTILGAQRSDGGTYRLVASNSFGMAISAEAVLTLVPVITWGGNGSGELNVPAGASNAVQIASGQWHNLALRADGRVVGWGWNSSGQSTIPSSATNVVGIAAGFEHDLALRADGTIEGWGTTCCGDPATVPPSATNIVAVAAGNYHSLALRADGTVLGWGFGDFGQVSIPAAATNVVAIAGGGYWSLALKADGTVLAWGDGRYGSLNVPGDLSNVVAIAAGFDPGLALRSDGTLAGWGVDFSAPPGGPSGLSNNAAVAAGSFHMLAIRTDGTVNAWGKNVSGQTVVPPNATNVVAVRGGDTDSMALVQDPGLPVVPGVWVQEGSRVVAVGSTFTLLSRTFGSLPLRCQWLFNGGLMANQTNSWLPFANIQTNQAGDYQLVVSNDYGAATSGVVTLTVLRPPAFVVSPTNQTWIVGGSGSLAALATGEEPLAYQWYRGVTKLVDDARLSGSTSNVLSISGVLAADAGTYTVVATNLAGSATSAAGAVTVVVPSAITAQPKGWSVPVGLPVTLSAAASGTAPLAYQWRLNGADVPGATSNVLRFAALALSNFGNYQLVATNLGGAATSAVAPLTVGSVATWGAFSAAANFPIWPPPGLSNVIAVAGGSGYSLALRGDGTVLPWNNNPGATVPNPVVSFPPSGLSGIVAIAAGYSHALALRSNGTVLAWGSNTSGQTNVPAGLSNVVAVTAGYGHSAALRADGTVVVWGFIPRENQTNVPPGLIDVDGIDADGSQTLALRENGTVAGWGGSFPTPVPSFLSQVASVSAGTTSLAVLTNGTLVAWTATGLATNVPPGLTNIIAVATSPNSVEQLSSAAANLALRSNGAIVGWGSSTATGITNVPSAVSNAVAIAAGSLHALAIINDGRPIILRPPVGGTFYTGGDLILKARVVGTAPLGFQWFKDGNPIAGATSEKLVLPSAQFGDAGSYHLAASNSFGVAQSIAVPVTIVDGAPVLFSQPASRFAYYGSPVSVGASVVGSGPMHFNWLQNGSPLAGDANELVFPRALPQHDGSYQLIASNPLGSVTSSVAQITFTRIVAWGNGPSLTNAPLDLSSVVGVGSGYYHALAIRSNGTVAAWGTTLNGATNVPPGLSEVVAVAGGDYFSLALKRDGSVAAWGLGSSGQTNPPAGLSDVRAISAGDNHALALRSNGTVVAWGSNASGKTNVPAGLSNVVAVAAGSAHSLALKNDGTIVGWGLAGKIPANTNVVAIAAGYGQSLALQADGTVLAWTIAGGAVSFAPGLTNMVAISIGGGLQASFLNAALRSDGTPVAWGNNNTGNQWAVPAGLASAISISVGGGSTLALLNDRSPAFTVQPWDRRVAVSSNVTLTALAAGQSPLSYQWFKDGGAIAGRTNASITITNVLPSQAGGYQAVAQNNYGAATSTVAILTVSVPAVKLTPVGMTGGGFQFFFSGLAGVQYIIEYQDALGIGPWIELERRVGQGGLEVVTDPTFLVRRYYRVRSQ